MNWRKVRILLRYAKYIAYKMSVHHNIAYINNPQKGDNMEGLVELLNGLKGTIEALSLQLIDAQNALNVEVKAAYDKGFAEGVASMGHDSEKIYSQVDLDNAVMAAVAPLNAQIEDLKSQMVSIQEGIQPKIDAALVEFKAVLLAQYEAQQVAESESETGFKNLLA